MSETYEQMRDRIQPERYEVLRRTSGVARMSRGDETWEEPQVWATIVRRQPRRVIESGLCLNSLTVCLPEGPSGKFPRGIDATDEELILAIVGDESVFDPYPPSERGGR